MKKQHELFHVICHRYFHKDIFIVRFTQKLHKYIYKAKRTIPNIIIPPVCGLYGKQSPVVSQSLLTIYGYLQQFAFASNFRRLCQQRNCFIKQIIFSLDWCFVYIEKGFFSTGFVRTLLKLFWSVVGGRSMRLRSKDNAIASVKRCVAFEDKNIIFRFQYTELFWSSSSFEVTIKKFLIALLLISFILRGRISVRQIFGSTHVCCILNFFSHIYSFEI